MDIYNEFDKYIILNQVHRVNVIKEPKTPEDHAYNKRAQDFLHLLHRVRDVEMTKEDYYNLVKRKKSNLSLSERMKFTDAPVLMDFRKETTKNQ